MYSVILLAAMTAPADQPAFGRLLRSGCAGCAGYACSGCYGCVGGWYSGWGYGGYACGGCGGCRGWSTSGYKTFFSCHGAGACFGYAYAGVSFGFAGCYGSCYGSYTNYFSYWAFPTAGYPVHGAPVGTVGPVGPAVGTGPMELTPQPTSPATKPEGAKPEGTNPGTKPEGTNPGTTASYIPNQPMPATVIVTLPADARLMANGQPTKQTLAERVFNTPPLKPGARYHYDFTAEIVRDGKTITETQQVEVFAGHETRVTFTKLMAATAIDPAHIAGR